MRNYRTFVRKNSLFLLILFFFIGNLHAQKFGFEPIQSISVTDNNIVSTLAWAGGINNAQVSELDLNQDSQMDVIVFDQSTNKLLPFIATGNTGNYAYKYAPEYEKLFPEIRNWCLFFDYNQDGKQDIFTSVALGATVFKNTSTIQDGLQFERAKDLLLSQGATNLSNINIPPSDVPGIADIDGDGDLDILTFNISGKYIEYHMNVSQDKYNHSDSLEFIVSNKCWGQFSEDESTNTLLLNDISSCTNTGINPKSPSTRNRKHVGSSILILDLDGNEVMDLLIGDISFPTINAVINGGTAPNTNSVMKEQINNYPTSHPIDMSVFPASYFLDVTHDGKKDLLVSPNSPGLISKSDHSLWLYENKGTNESPIFEFSTDGFLQNQMIDRGVISKPILFDYNNDQLLDLFVANFGFFNEETEDFTSKIALYKNTGTAQVPAFEKVNDDYANLSQLNIGENLHPAFGDFDGDTDIDLIIGTRDGKLLSFVNPAGPNPDPIFNSNYTEVKLTTGEVFDAVQYASPFAYDVDKDDRLDLIVGNNKGTISYLRNAGTNPVTFELITSDFGGINVKLPWAARGYCTPILYEYKNELQLISGSEYGGIHHFNNLEDNLGGNFSRLDTNMAFIWNGLRSSVAIGDLTGDGEPELITGNYRGGVNLYQYNKDKTTFVDVTNNIELKVYPNPVHSELRIELSETISLTSQIQLFDITGKLVLNSILSNRVHSINTDSFENGIYLLRITDNHKQWQKKIIIQH